MCLCCARETPGEMRCGQHSLGGWLEQFCETSRPYARSRCHKYSSGLYLRFVDFVYICVPRKGSKSNLTFSCVCAQTLWYTQQLQVHCGKEICIKQDCFYEYNVPTSTNACIFVVVSCRTVQRVWWNSNTRIQWFLWCIRIVLVIISIHGQKCNCSKYSIHSRSRINTDRTYRPFNPWIICSLNAAVITSAQ